MSMVVERGLARCPRCVSMADYVFIEFSAEVYSGMLRYEVRCRKCGECYGEESRPTVHAAVVVAEPPIVWPPDCEPVPPRDRRAELRQRAAELRHRTAEVAARARTEGTRARDETTKWVTKSVQKARTIRPADWFRRDEAQTGGVQTGG
ncbi:hypothetical protein JDV09_19400 [Mycobacterium sp. Y57]|uniref:hypothetical protein n=1 Tax=Mycolicibacterium xanthum TaxID=2796469 RepID=UPI001C840E40|nr:hypothetical protein [Mycolicibacterium xanthum]MBX7434251.1 hypothetical protein [Mycolicibacterium xanthum]